MKIIFSPHFRRSYKKLIANNEILKSTMASKMQLFSKNPQDVSLKDHPLKGKLKGYRSFSIGYDLRAIYRREKEELIFFDIGTHDEVY